MNPKASAVPNQPGEFWPVVSNADEAPISWYQFANANDIAAIQDLQHRVGTGVAAQTTFENEVYRQMRDAGLPTLLHHVQTEPEPRFPHHALYYLDAGDARAWGHLFGRQIQRWVDAYAAAPETLDQHMWRLHWSE